MPRSSQWFLAFGPPNQNPVSTSPLPHACHMSSPSDPPWFNHPNNIRRKNTIRNSIKMGVTSPLDVNFMMSVKWIHTEARKKWKSKREKEETRGKKRNKVSWKFCVLKIKNMAMERNNRAEIYERVL
jgi:hypothetical protein